MTELLLIAGAILFCVFSILNYEFGYCWSMFIGRSMSKAQRQKQFMRPLLQGYTPFKSALASSLSLSLILVSLLGTVIYYTGILDSLDDTIRDAITFGGIMLFVAGSYVRAQNFRTMLPPHWVKKFKKSN